MAIMKVEMCLWCDRYIETSRLPCSSVEIGGLRRSKDTIADAVCEGVVGKKFPEG